MKKIILPILVLMTLGLVATVYGGTCTVNKPAASELWRGATALINVTTTTVNIGNCTVVVTSALTGDSDSFYIYNATSGTFCNNTVSITGIMDSDDIALAITCVNKTNHVTIDTCSRTGITVDNTKPVISSPSPSDDTTQEDDAVDFSVTCTNASSATLYLGGDSYAMTESSDVCTYNGLILGDGTRDWYVVADDGTNSTTSSTYGLHIELSSSQGGAAPVEYIAQKVTEKKQSDALAMVGVSKETQSSIKGWIQKETSTKELIKTSGLALAGGVAGFFIIPVLGVVPGAILGSIIGLVI